MTRSPESITPPTNTHDSSSSAREQIVRQEGSYNNDDGNVQATANNTSIVNNDQLNDHNNDDNDDNEVASVRKDLEKVRSNNTSLIQLDWNYRYVGDEEAKALGEGLPSNTTLTVIKLRNSSISAEGAKAISEGLRNNKTLIAIYLGLNDIGNEGAKALGKALRNNTTLTTIELSQNKIGDEGATALAEGLENNRTLTYISLLSNEIGAEGAKAIGEGLGKDTTLTAIDLAANRIGTEGAKALAEGLGNNKTLNYIRLGINGIGYEGAMALGKVLRNNTTLRQIALRNNDIGNEGAKALAEGLENNKTLNYISLGDNKIGYEGATALGKALRNNTTLRTIALRNNNIGNEGAKAIGEGLENNKTLTSIELYGNNIDPDTIAIIDTIATKNRRKLEQRRDGAAVGKQKIDTDKMQTQLLHNATRKLKISNLCVVGDGRAGKTSLVTVLRDMKFNSTQEKTSGIDTCTTDVREDARIKGGTDDNVNRSLEEKLATGMQIEIKGKKIQRADLHNKDAVVIVGLWNFEKRSLVGVGSGFIADESKGLILTAAHIFYDIEGIEGRPGSKYRGLKGVKAIIGVEGNDMFTAHFTYFADIISNVEDITNADAVVLKITEKIKEPFQWEPNQEPNTFQCETRAMRHGEFRNEKMKKLELINITTSNPGDEVTIVGYDQSGEGRHNPGAYINYKASIATGYVCQLGHSGQTSVATGARSFISATQSEIIIEKCPIYGGQSGGPCVNEDGKVIGILCRGHHTNKERCYIVQAFKLEKILKKAARSIRRTRRTRRRE